MSQTGHIVILLHRHLTQLFSAPAFDKYGHLVQGNRFLVLLWEQAYFTLQPASQPAGVTN